MVNVLWVEIQEAPVQILSCILFPQRAGGPAGTHAWAE